MAAKAVIAAETELIALAHLEWKSPKTHRKSIDRIRTVMQQFQGEPGMKKSVALSRKLGTALQALDGYLSGQSQLADQLR